MTIETFTKQDFEQFLDTMERDNTLPWQELGLRQGEYAYLLPLDNQVSIQVRSSVKENGLSADTGDDSIRGWLVTGNNKPLGSKVNKWTNRTPGWQARFRDVLIQLTKWRMQAGDCKDCNKPLGVFKVKKENKNKGRLFASCKYHNNFKWLDKGDDNVYFSEQSHCADVDEASNGKLEDKPEQLDELSSDAGQFADVLRKAKGEAIPTDDIESSTTEQPNNVSDVPSDIELNEQQRQAVYAPIDSNVRVLAGPGSGKSSGVIVPRYVHLVEQGIAPEKIVCVAFNKTMADELIEKITKALPDLSDMALKQICTINAFCYRELVEYWKQSRKKRLAIYDWKNPYMKSATNPEWMIKDIIDEVYSGWDRKPSTSEVLGWINTSKHTGLSLKDSRGWFNNALQEHGGHIYEIREKYDKAMQYQSTMDFADQLYIIERLLIEKIGFRTGLQSKYSHILVDEAQDVSSQALRILVTISQDMGWNEIYKEMK